MNRSTLMLAQTPYYWPSQNHHPDNVEYAVYLHKRSLRNKQKHGLEDYEAVRFSFPDRVRIDDVDAIVIITSSVANRTH